MVHMNRCALVTLALIFLAGGQRAYGQATTPPEARLSRKTLGEESWFTNQYSRDMVTVGIRGVTDPVVCQKQKVTFMYLTTTTGSRQIPTETIPAQWVSNEREVGQCQASIRWRLGDAPGLHQLRARLERDPASPVSPAVVDSQTVQFRATAHAPASLIIGLARGSSEPDEKEYTPIVGADFPIVYHALEPLYPALNHIRISLATQFGAAAGENLFVGLQVFPLLEGPRVTAFPLQFTVGYRTGKGADGAFIAVHYNASSALAGC